MDASKITHFVWIDDAWVTKMIAHKISQNCFLSCVWMIFHQICTKSQFDVMYEASKLSESVAYSGIKNG